MWRTALRPRWLVLLAAVLVLCSAMAWLGTWQLGRARDQGDAAKQARVSIPPVPLRQVLGPQTAFPAAGVDRPVMLTGAWEGAGQLLLPERWLEGRQGFWVLTPLRLDDGSVIAVLRGWTDSAADAARGATALPTTPVSLTGVLRPGEEAVTRNPGETSGLPTGQLERVDPVELIERWSGSIYSGFVVLTAPEQAGLTPVPPATGNGRLALQNLSYAVQWFIFAGFGLFLWFRLVRDDHRGLLGGRVPGASTEQAGLTP